MSGSSQVTVLDPVATVQGDLRTYPLAPRTPSLSGKAIGLYWNVKRGGDVALKRVGEVLQSRYPSVELAWYQDYFPAAPETYARVARECQAVVGASGD